MMGPRPGARAPWPVRVGSGRKAMAGGPRGFKFANPAHHHRLVDAAPPAGMSAPLPATDKILHFGKGQTEAAVPLSPGKHTLQLLLGDQNHVPHNPPVISSRITITVTG